MGRYSETHQNKAYAKNALPPVLNMAVQGNQGYLTEMQYYPSATDYIRKPLIIKVLQAPAGLMMLPNGSAYVAAYKNLIENWMQSWQGFNRTLSVNTQETQLGNAGEVFQTPSRVARARSQISSTVVEKDNMPVIRFLEDMVRYLIMDPDTGHPLLSGVSEQFTDQLADIYGGTILAWEPDKTFKKVQKAWLITNFWPHQDIGENTGNRQLQTDGETLTYNLNWTGWQKVGYAVDKLAQGFMDAVRVTGIDPQYQKNFIEAVDSNVAAISQSGYQEQITLVKRGLVTP
jgi:hypothetical protein